MWYTLYILQSINLVGEFQYFTKSKFIEKHMVVKLNPPKQFLIWNKQHGYGLESSQIENWKKWPHVWSFWNPKLESQPIELHCLSFNLPLRILISWEYIPWTYHDPQESQEYKWYCHYFFLGGGWSEIPQKYMLSGYSKRLSTMMLHCGKQLHSFRQRFQKSLVQKYWNFGCCI